MKSEDGVFLEFIYNMYTVQFNAIPGGGSGSGRVLNEVRAERTFGKDTSPKALNAFLGRMHKLPNCSNDRAIASTLEQLLKTKSFSKK